MPIDPETRARPGRAADRRPVAQPRRLPHADAVGDEPGGGFTTADATPWLPFGDLAALQRRGAAGGPRLDAAPRARPDRAAQAAPRPDAPARTRRCRRRTARGRGGAASGFAVALNLSDAEVAVDGLTGRVAVGTDRGRDGEAVGGALRLGPYEGVVVERCGERRRAASTPLLSEEGWAYASLPPQEPGDPGRFHALFGRDSLICALQVLPAAPEVARATLRALAARQGRVDDPETDEEPGKILHEYRPRGGRVVRRGRLAGARRRAALLRHRRRDELVPGRARRARRRGAAAELEPAWRAAAALAGRRARRAAAASCATARAAARRPRPAGLARRDRAGRAPPGGRGHRARRTAASRPRRWPTPTARPPRWRRSTRSRGWIPAGGWARAGGRAAARA